MDFGLKGRVAVVAASSQGLGKATAIALAAEGAHVVMCARDKKRILMAAKEVRKLAGKKGPEVIPLAADVSKAQDITRVVQAAHKKF